MLTIKYQSKWIIGPLEKPEYSLRELLLKCAPDKMSLGEEDGTWLNESPVGKEAI